MTTAKLLARYSAIWGALERLRYRRHHYTGRDLGRQRLGASGADAASISIRSQNPLSRAWTFAAGARVGPPRKFWFLDGPPRAENFEMGASLAVGG